LIVVLSYILASILYRDLKPENVGVNLRGDYILFDFGLAKELKRIDLVQPPDGFEATGMTGSRRYMAPEVVSCKHYGFRADVYSFAILFWETMSLQIPYPKMTLDQHFEQVVVKGKRPKLLKNILPKQMEQMMEEGWLEDPLKRPSFKSICDRLYEEISNREGTVAGNGMEERTKYLLDKSNVSRTDSIKECC
jgi:serine/threonine protein kinase